MKKAISLLLSVFLILGLLVPVHADETGVLSLGRVSAVMPTIQVELRGTGFAENQIEAALDGQSLHIDSVEPYDNASHRSRVYVLVDLSTSMRKHFEQVKKNVLALIESMGASDELVLITFGQTQVQTVYSGNAQQEEAAEVVRGLECTEKGTMFFEALSRAYQMSSTSVELFDREYVIAFSDGIDYQIGSTTFEEVLQMYSSQNLPLYAACSSNTSKAASNQFGQIARSSGGSLKIIKKADVFEEFLGEINDVTLITFSADSNRADGKEHQLTLKVGGSQVELNIPLSRSQADTEAPVVEEAFYDAQQGVLVIRYSEAVLGADAASAYKVTNSQGTALRIDSVYYSEEDDRYELRLADPVYNDSYTIDFSRITDDSREANSLTGRTAVVIENGLVPEGTDGKDDGEKGLGGLLPLVVIAVIAVIALAAAAVVLASHSKQKEEEPEKIVPEVRSRTDKVYEHRSEQYEQIRHHIQAESKVRIRLNIRTGRTSEQNIEMDLLHSLIIGRSQTCDIFIDDAKLSRQHFVIENDGGELYIMDLQSRNGTMVNGVRLNNRQKLNNGDKILAGLSDVVVSIVSR